MIPPSEVRVQNSRTSYYFESSVGRRGLGPWVSAGAEGLVPGGRDAGGGADTTGRSEKKEVSVQPMSTLRRLLRARGRYRPRAKRGPDVTGARRGQSPTKGPQQTSTQPAGTQQSRRQRAGAGERTSPSRNVVEVA